MLFKSKNFINYADKTFLINNDLMRKYRLCILCLKTLCRVIKLRENGIEIWPKAIERHEISLESYKIYLCEDRRPN